MGIAGGGLRYRCFRGAEIAEVKDDLARLRMTVFRDFPYLYEGTMAYERNYLQTYINSGDAFLFSVYDSEAMVGATTCIPLKDETPEVKEPFLKAGAEVEGIFYFGESILLKPYRGLGLGKLFFEEREKHAAALAGVNTLCFCAVRRPYDHPLRPGDYQPLDTFWEKVGYRKSADIVSHFVWNDLGGNAPSTKLMEYWFKKI